MFILDLVALILVALIPYHIRVEFVIPVPNHPIQLAVGPCNIEYFHLYFLHALQEYPCLISTLLLPMNCLTFPKHLRLCLCLSAPDRFLPTNPSSPSCFKDLSFFIIFCDPLMLLKIFKTVGSSSLGKSSIQ